MTDHPKGEHLHEDDSPAPTFREKAAKLIDHWIRHNTDHAANYLKWRDEFERQQMPEVAELLSSAAELSGHITMILKQAGEQLPE